MEADGSKTSEELVKQKQTAQHTPGPAVCEWGPGYLLARFKNQNGHHLRIKTCSDSADSKKCLSALWNQVNSQPDLLKACKAALDPDPCSYDHNGLCQAHTLRTNNAGEPECEQKLLREAIAKAEKK